MLYVGNGSKEAPLCRFHVRRRLGSDWGKRKIRISDFGILECSERTMIRSSEQLSGCVRSSELRGRSSNHLFG